MRTHRLPGGAGGVGVTITGVASGCGALTTRAFAPAGRAPPGARATVATLGVLPAPGAARLGAVCAGTGSRDALGWAAAAFDATFGAGRRADGIAALAGAGTTAAGNDGALSVGVDAVIGAVAGTVEHPASAAARTTAHAVPGRTEGVARRIRNGVSQDIDSVKKPARMLRKERCRVKGRVRFAECTTRIRPSRPAVPRRLRPDRRAHFPCES